MLQELIYQDESDDEEKGRALNRNFKCQPSFSRREHIIKCFYTGHKISRPNFRGTKISRTFLSFAKVNDNKVHRRYNA